MLDGFQQTRRGHVMPDRIAAIEQALALAQPGDGVLISGCGEQPIATIGDEQWQVTDRDVCQAWLFEGNRDNGGATPGVFRIDDFRP
jgi:UDP-N-acetylmuramoyl-L-alanyl-D-glutamate--2,6-diaminopimelate ligase